MGYLLNRQALTEQALDCYDQAINTMGKWFSILAGRTDALQDDRPQVCLLALNLAIRSLIATERAPEAISFADMALKLAEQHFPSHPCRMEVRAVI